MESLDDKIEAHGNDDTNFRSSDDDNMQLHQYYNDENDHDGSVGIMRTASKTEGLDTFGDNNISTNNPLLDNDYHHPEHNNNNNNNTYRAPSLRGEGYGGGGGIPNDATNVLRNRRGNRRWNNHSSSSIAAAVVETDNTIQSHNYETDENEVWRAYVTQLHFQNRGQWWTTSKQRAWNRWVLTFIVGVTQAVVAATCNFLSKALSAFKFQTVNDLLQVKYHTNTTTTTVTSFEQVIDSDGNVIDDNDTDTIYSSNTNNTWKALGYFVLFQLLYTAISSMFVWIEPLSGGSGIPEIKCFLNGIDIPRIARVKTLLCRVLGCIFSVAAGLPIGMEGPMVHSGAVVAAGISQGKTRLWGMFDTSFSKFSDFRNDREKRDFVACGTAAGVCSAFGSPVGGVLFAFEETSSFFTTKLTWRAFFCAMTTLGTLFWIRNIGTRWGQADIEKLFSLGEFNSLSGDDSNFSIWELSLFVIVGCLGGLIGAVFNAASEKITKWRMKNVNHSKVRRLIEVLLISITVSLISFVTPLLWGKCTPLPTVTDDWTREEKRLVAALVPFQCIPGKEYNEVASLTFTDSDAAIKQLFHFREVDDTNTRTTSTFSSGAVFLFFIPYIVMATITYGSAVPSGLFVPSLLSGAAFGRLVAHLLHKLDHTHGTFADAGTYALIGSAAILGGMARMTISLTVILLEATGDMQYVLPLMLTLMAARFTGNAFNDGIYDINIKLKKIPFLEPDVPGIAERNEIVAGQVMATEVKCLRPIERVGVVYDLLRSCGHGNFPIVDTTTGGTLCGTVSRNILCTLLQREAFGLPDVMEDDNESRNDSDGQQQIRQPLVGPRRLSPLVQWDTFERVYPRYPTISDIEIKSCDRSAWIDLRPYTNTAPYTVNETASIQRTYRLFRTLGLRFLCVVNHNNQVVGIITRKDLMPEALTYSLLRGRNAHVVEEGVHQVI